MLFLRFRAACIARSICHEMAYRHYGMSSATYTASIRAAIVRLAEAGF